MRTLLAILLALMGCQQNSNKLPSTNIARNFYADINIYNLEGNSEVSDTLQNGIFELIKVSDSERTIIMHDTMYFGMRPYDYKKVKGVWQTSYSMALDTCESDVYEFITSNSFIRLEYCKSEKQLKHKLISVSILKDSVEVFYSLFPGFDHDPNLAAVDFAKKNSKNISSTTYMIRQDTLSLKRIKSNTKAKDAYCFKSNRRNQSVFWWRSFMWGQNKVSCPNLLVQ